MTDLGRIELDLSRMTLSQQLLLARILCGKGLLAALLDALFRAVLWLQRVADARDPPE